MQQSRYHIVLNPQSGTALATGISAEELTRRFEAHGYSAVVEDGGTLASRIEKALRSDAEVIVAAGGDGTVTALAGAMIDSDKTLAVLPLGTANLLAHDLGVPLDLDQTIAALGQMQKRLIDVGEVNGRIFLHKVVIGLIPGIAAAREQVRGRNDLRAKLEFVSHFFARILNARRIAVEINPREGEARVARVQSIAVANNDYDEGLGRFFSRERLDAGNLSLYVLKHLTLTDIARLTLGMLLGNWRQDEALEIANVSAVTVRTRKPRLRAMIDGEVETLAVPLTFRIRPAALSVLAPAAAGKGQAERAEPNMTVDV